MSIQIKQPSGKVLQMDVQFGKTTVNDVKKKVMEKSGLSLDSLVIVFRDEILKNENSLKQYGIDNKDMIEAETAETIFKKCKDKLENEVNWKIQLENEWKEKLDDQVNKWQDKFSEELSKLDELEKKLALAESKEDEWKQEIQKLESELNLAKNKLKNQEKVIAKFEENQQQQYKGNETKNLESEVAKLQAIITRNEMDKTELSLKVQYYNQEKLDLQKRAEDYQKLKEELMIKTFEIKTLQREIEFATSRGSQTKEEINKELDQSRQQIKNLEQKLEEVKIKNQELEIEKVKRNLRDDIDQNQIDKLNALQQQNIQYEKRIAEYKAQVFSLNDQVKQLQSKSQDELRSTISRIDYVSAEKIQNYELQINKLNSELKSSQKSLEESQIQLSAARKQCFESDKKIMELEKSLENITYLMKEKDRGIKEKEQIIKKLQIEIDELNKDLALYQKNLKDYKQIALEANPKKMSEIDCASLKIEERLKAREEQRVKEERMLEQQKQEELNRRSEKLKLEQQQYNDIMQKNKEQRKRTAQFLKKQMMESHGKIEVCFLIDVTGSMDPYKEQAMKCIKESMNNIKLKTNRDALWATVAYQDLGELKQLGGKYRQLDFTPNPKEIEDYLDDIPCAGGGDAAEDIRGGIMQMVNNLTWSKTFKIAILICDAPTHGKRYNGGVSDRYPNDDIEDAINLLIEKNILFVAILFTKETKIMFQEIRNIYIKADKEELLIFADLENTQQGKIWQELVDLVSQASQRVTQTNNKGTRSKTNQDKKGSQSGAMEALCKSIKDPFQFDKLPGVSVIPVKFGVYRVELKQDSFESNIENIKRLDINRDYSVYEEGQWDCIRTEKQFAEGQMKKVFLMKRVNNQNELYVIKMPLGDQTYKSQDQAVVECRSHLISKCLMKKFIRVLQETRDQRDKSMKIPEVQYSDFLILKDLSKRDSYWIAERFFNGEFVKYNNNYGYISEENSEINHLAQAYSYYTYYISNYNYMVNDVQGVGNYFTDPALNTKDGSFDETDLGIDGQSMFIVCYEGKRNIGKKYLDLLGIS